MQRDSANTVTSRPKASFHSSKHEWLDNGEQTHTRLILWISTFPPASFLVVSIVQCQMFDLLSLFSPAPPKKNRKTTRRWQTGPWLESANILKPASLLTPHTLLWTVSVWKLLDVWAALWSGRGTKPTLVLFYLCSLLPVWTDTVLCWLMHLTFQ